MLITQASLTALRTGFSTVFQTSLNQQQARSMYKRVAMTVNSTDVRETYGWLKDDARMRKWLGPRVVNALAENAYVVENEPFEYTVGVKRTDILFDKLGTYGQRFINMGRAAGDQPDLLVWALAKAGFASNSFDGQFFFDTDHPVQLADGTMGTYANTDGGAGAPWFLIDTKKGMMPFIYQEAIAPTFVSKDKPEDDNAFMNNEFVYGVDMFCQAGFGLPALAWGSKQTLDATAYATARSTMGSYKGDHGSPLGITPDLLVVGPSNESAGRKIVNSEYGTGGITNEWKGTAELLVVPWLA